VISRLRNDLEVEKQNSDSLYDEMESLSTELSNLEKEKQELEKKYADSMESLKMVPGAENLARAFDNTMAKLQMLILAFLTFLCTFWSGAKRTAQV